MKKLFLPFLLAIGLALPASAQDEELTSIFAISPIGAIKGGLDVVYQMKITNFLALTVPASFYYDWTYPTAVGIMVNKTGDFTSTKAPISYAGGLGAKFLLAGNGIADSFYIEPRISAGYTQFGVKYNAQGKEKTLSNSHVYLFPMVRFGWDWVYKTGVYLSLGLGLGPKIYFKNKTEMPNDIDEKNNIRYMVPSEKQKIALAGDGEFKIGYAW